MREIKFRAWDIGEKDWIHPKHVNIYTDGSTGPLKYIVGGVADSGISFQQFTGLKDKNGNEIYEGDIVQDRYYKQKRIVSWSNEYLCWSLRNITEPDGLNAEKSMDLFVDDGFEVIGNIYENPELLGEVK